MPSYITIATIRAEQAAELDAVAPDQTDLIADWLAYEWFSGWLVDTSVDNTSTYDLCPPDA